MKRLISLAACLTFAACGHSYIQGTTVADSDENREIYVIVEDLRVALEQRDVGRILSHVSPTYFEDMGTPQPTDDYGFEELSKKVLPESLAATKEMYVALEVQDIVVEGDRAHADMRYSSRARIDVPSGAFWDTHREFNRIEFTREEGTWRVVSGL